GRRRALKRIHQIHVTTVRSIPGTQSVAEHIRHQWTAERQARLVTGVATLGRRPFGAREAAESFEIGLTRHEPDGSALRLCAEQRPLRTRQYLDALEIEVRRQGTAEGVAPHCRQRNVIEEQTGAAAVSIAYPTDDDVGVNAGADAGEKAEVDTRDQRTDIGQALDPEVLHCLRVEEPQCHRLPRQLPLPARTLNDDLL